MDLNIDHYDFDDILKLFKLPYHFSEKDLKTAKKIVLQTHPDKSGLNKDYFLFFSKAYKLLYKVFVFRSKVNTRQRDDKDYDAEDVEEFEKENEELITRIKNSNNFNKVFNELFVNMNMVQEDDGYGDWLKQDTGIDIAQCKTPNDMKSVLNEYKNKSCIVRHEIKDYYSTNSSQQTLDDNIQSYGAGLFSKLQYDDLKTAHEESIIPVADTNNIKQKSLDNIKQERSIIEKPIEKKTAEHMLTTQMLADHKEANIRAFKLAKKTAENEEKQTIWWSKFKQILEG